MARRHRRRRRRGLSQVPKLLPQPQPPTTPTPSHQAHWNATASTFWPDQITVGHVVFDFPAPYLPHLEPSLLFLRPFPAVSGHQHTSSSLDGVTLYSTEGNDWYPYLSCGWFPVLVIYPNLQPILAHAWVHVSPSFLPGPPGCTPPMFGARTLSTNNIYVGRQFIHTFRSSAAV